ncbi:PhzF family phenazine biosynthesis protein [Massilia sp. YIM B02769]|uniref:PhzF family phenazine biosynthesis protein n=1 Tax=unclassified Massilia TaxID=2609279 RepID=UPI0025B6AB95|nr:MULTISPECIES: PhzF family phenazine biosynthesis protein [unclassified Massilia]MDN4057202.1 PhzF family phenazine biosynthesis protein [Massilia sp. YIM B02769]
MRVHEFDCFGVQAGEGNPALVIEEGNSNPGWRRAFARERGVTCVFVDPVDAQGEASSAVAVLDYVYPHARSPLCVHATLAAAQLLFERHGSGAPLAVTTAMHGQPLVLSRDGEHVFVRLERQDAPALELDTALPLRLLSAPDLVLASPPRVLSVGSPKLLLEVEDMETLYALQPDLALIHVWGKNAGVNGCYVWCRTAEGEVEGRNFNHIEPALEDSATGVAAGALTLLLGQALTVRQGRATGHACSIRTALEVDAVLVGGLVSRGVSPG